MGNRRDFRADSVEPVDPEELFVFVGYRVPPILADVKCADLMKDWDQGVADLLRAIR